MSHGGPHPARGGQPAAPRRSGTIPKNAPGTLTLSGTVRWADIRGSMAGAYTDSMVVSILP